MTISITNAAAVVGLDAIADLVDGGSGAGTLRFYSGTVPTDADTALSGNTLLAQITLSDPAFAGSTDGTGKATAAIDTTPALTDSSANATGTASFFRILDSDSTVVVQGSVTATSGGGDIELTTVSIVASAEVTVTSFNLEMPEAGA